MISIKLLNILINTRMLTFGGMGGGLAKQGLTENCVPRSGPEDMFTEWVLAIIEL